MFAKIWFQMSFLLMHNIVPKMLLLNSVSTGVKVEVEVKKVDKWLT